MNVRVALFLCCVAVAILLKSCASAFVFNGKTYPMTDYKPESITAWNDYAAAKTAKQWEKAQEILTKIITTDEKFAVTTDAWAARAEVFFNLNRFAEARKDANEAVKRTENSQGVFLSDVSCTKSPRPLTPLENAVISEINLARKNPKLYATFVEKRYVGMDKEKRFQEDGTIYQTMEGRKAVDEAIQFLRSVQPVDTLTTASCMTLAADDHVRDIGTKGLASHDGTDKSTPLIRVSRYINRTLTMGIGENLCFGQRTARNIVLALIVDDGVPDRGHRTNIFQLQYAACGVAFGFHAKYGVLCVQNFSVINFTP